jgi:hypothetical protein
MDKYASLVTARKDIWGKVELVAVPIGHAGTTLAAISHSLAQVLSDTILEIAQARSKRQVINPDTESAARTHDSSIFKSLMEALSKLAQSRLIGIIHNRQSLVHNQEREISRTRAHSVATSAHTQGIHKQGGAHTSTRCMQHSSRRAP